MQLRQCSAIVRGNWHVGANKFTMDTVCLRTTALWPSTSQPQPCPYLMDCPFSRMVLKRLKQIHGEQVYQWVLVLTAGAVFQQQDTSEFCREDWHDGDTKENRVLD